jgi:hypothetical protein
LIASLWTVKTGKRIEDNEMPMLLTRQQILASRVTMADTISLLLMARDAPIPGAFRMHSHQGMQDQSLMTAPLIAHSAED